MKITLKILFLSALVFAVVGCKRNPYSSLNTISTVTKSEGDLVVFKDLSKAKVYKTKVHLYKHYFSGLLAFKKINDSYRVIFTSEMGMKFFDFEFAPDTFKTHYVMEKFDNKYVLQTLQEDIGQLLFYHILPLKLEELAAKDTTIKLLQLKNEKSATYYFLNSQGNQLRKIEKWGVKKIKVTYTMDNYVDNIPLNININHSDFKLNIELNNIKR